MKPTMSGLSAKRLVTSGIAMPSEKTERPSISVPPLVNNQSQYFAASHRCAVERRLISRVRFYRAHGMLRAELLLGGGCLIPPLTGLGAAFRAFCQALFFARRGVVAADRGDVNVRRRQLQPQLVHGVDNNV